MPGKVSWIVLPGMDSSIPCFLADTWWFGLSQRFCDKDFEALSRLRVAQGFTAIQMVVGVPPEVGPSHPSAKSCCGAPWDRKGQFNTAYLTFARERIQYLNQLGLMVIVYGAWGYQIEWLGLENMMRWWSTLIKNLDDLNIIYCLTGEVNLWVGNEDCLLPDKNTKDLSARKGAAFLPKSMATWLKSFYIETLPRMTKKRAEKRRADWSRVLEFMATQTGKPIIVHTEPHELGYEALPSSCHLAVNTAQTGHDPGSRDRLWALPLKAYNRGERFINLEPWYEGIFGRFFLTDQLYAYWASMLGGAAAYCYGAQGIWNVGDGVFLSQWGRQTFSEAMALDSPSLIGLSHKEFLKWNTNEKKIDVCLSQEKLYSISYTCQKGSIYYFPEIAVSSEIPKGTIWIPQLGHYVETLPPNGQVVIFQTNSVTAC